MKTFLKFVIILTYFVLKDDYMYLNIKSSILKPKNKFNSKDDYYNFRCHLLKSNLNKYSIISFIVVFIMTVFLIMDVIMFEYFPSTIILYIEPIIIIIAIISSILNIMVNNYLSSKINIKNVKIISLIFSYSLILWGVYIIFNIKNYTDSFYIYMLFQLVFMILLYDMPINKFIYHTVFFISIIIFIFNNNSTVQTAFYTLLKVFFIYAFSITISFISFTCALNDFLNNLKLKQSNEKLIELENAKTNYFTNVSHELRTPLNIILTSQDLLKVELLKNSFTSDNINKYLSITKQNSLRLTKLINNLIDITKLDNCSLSLYKKNVDISVTSKVNEGTTFTFTLPEVLDSNNVIRDTRDQNINEKIEIINIEFSDIYS